jgi:8-oxo-dGTP pyrophosphatase MutT (NUDIX family)
MSISWREFVAGRGSSMTAASAESLDRMGISSIDRSGRVLQSATIPFRRGPWGLQVLLVTSKETRRWVLPKGMIEQGMTAAQSAAVEAFEEAGVCGRVGARSLGRYTYRKSVRRGSIRGIVEVFPLQVRVVYRDWPERTVRRRAWMDVRVAATRIREPELRRILVAFADDGREMRPGARVC